MLSQVNESQNSWQTIGNTHNGFQSLASIITERFYNTLKDQSNYYLKEESKISVKKRQYKIKQTNYWPVFKVTIKVVDKQKDRVELKSYIY